MGNLTRAAALSRAPAKSADFALALESYFLAYEACTGAHFDRDKPDLTPIVGKLADPTCGNMPHVPHALEGQLFQFGDMLVKANKVDGARGVYATVKKTKDYPKWAFRSVVDARLATDLEARAHLYADSDPANDPSLGASPCLGCHQR